MRYCHNHVRTSDSSAVCTTGTTGDSSSHYSQVMGDGGWWLPDAAPLLRSRPAAGVPCTPRPLPFAASPVPPKGANCWPQKSAAAARSMTKPFLIARGGGGCWHLGRRHAEILHGGPDGGAAVSVEVYANGAVVVVVERQPGGRASPDQTPAASSPTAGTAFCSGRCLCRDVRRCPPLRLQ